jgi:hypothetical protein
MTSYAIVHLIEMLGVERGLTVLNFFTAMENTDVVHQRLKCPARPNLLWTKAASGRSAALQEV